MIHAPGRESQSCKSVSIDSMRQGSYRVYAQENIESSPLYDPDHRCGLLHHRGILLYPLEWRLGEGEPSKDDHQVEHHRYSRRTLLVRHYQTYRLNTRRFYLNTYAQNFLHTSWTHSYFKCFCRLMSYPETRLYSRCHMKCLYSYRKNHHL